MAAEHGELRAAIREMILIIQKISDKVGDERESLKALYSHSTVVFSFLESAGIHEKKQALTQGLKSLIEGVKVKDSSSVDAAIVNLKVLMKDVVNEVKIYTQNEQQHPKSKRNTPLPRRNETLDSPKPAHILANAPPLHQDVKRTHHPHPHPINEEPIKEKRAPPLADIIEPQLQRTDSTSLDLENSEQASLQDVSGWLRLITYLSALQAEAR